MPTEIELLSWSWGSTSPGTFEGSFEVDGTEFVFEDASSPAVWQQFLVHLQLDLVGNADPDLPDMLGGKHFPKGFFTLKSSDDETDDDLPQYELSDLRDISDLVPGDEVSTTLDWDFLI